MITFVTGVDAKIAIIGMTAIVLVYTLMGGMNAVIWTDVLQGFILFIGAGIVLTFLLAEVSPLSGALNTLAENDNKVSLAYPAWSAPVLSRGLLYVRGKEQLVCAELITAA